MLMRPGFAGEKDHAERVPIYHVGGIRSVLGCGVFDSGARVLECFCFPLIFEEREKGDPSYSVSEIGDTDSGGSDSGESFNWTENLEGESEDGDGEGSEGEDSDDQRSTDGSNSAYPQEDKHVCVDLSEVIISSGVYWSLLLQPVDDTLTKFRRVGMALIWPRGLKEIDSDVKTFEIV
ncbi:hypothetical protein K456DRAFT_35087 [Colletotrichum gloeosporioides 23]|nr:hypothetical protein K456DRAFT_35087 [Colletotrichum gloeosporioides 23]